MRETYMVDAPDENGLSRWQLDPPLEGREHVRIFEGDDWSTVLCDCCDKVLWTSNTCALGPVEVLSRWEGYEVPSETYRMHIRRRRPDGHLDVHSFDNDSFGLAILHWYDSLGIKAKEAARDLRILADGLEAIA